MANKKLLNERLMSAVINGSLDEVNAAIDQGAEVNHAGLGGWTPLINAVGDLKKFKLLLKHGADIDFPYQGAQKWHGCTALMFAASEGNVELVDFLLKNGADVNAINTRKETALTWSSYKGRTEMVKFLLNNSATIDHQDGCGYTALIWAAEGGHADTVNLLINRNANIELTSILGSSAFHKAAEFQRSDAFKALMIQPALFDSPSNCGKTPYDLAKEMECSEIMAIIEGYRKSYKEENVLSSTISNSKGLNSRLAF